MVTSSSLGKPHLRLHVDGRLEHLAFRQAPGMHPELIKALIRIGGTSPAEIAEELGISRMTVSHVIHGRGVSTRVAERVSQVIKKPVQEIWPGRYQLTTKRRHGARAA